MGVTYTMDFMRTAINAHLPVALGDIMHMDGTRGGFQSLRVHSHLARVKPRLSHTPAKPAGSS